MYKAQINLTRTTWATYRQMYQNIIIEEVEDAFRIALSMYSNPEIYSLQPILQNNFDAVCQTNNINEFKKMLININCFNISNPKKFYKPTKAFFDSMIPKTNFEALGLKLELEPSKYQINLEISNNPLTNPLYKIFVECMESLMFPNRTDSKLKGLCCWDEDSKSLITKSGPNPYFPDFLIKEDKPIVKTFLSKETHTQSVAQTNDKYLF
jgi:hypothetical protein